MPVQHPDIRFLSEPIYASKAALLGGAGRGCKLRHYT